MPLIRFLLVFVEFTAEIKTHNIILSNVFHRS